MSVQMIERAVIASNDSKASNAHEISPSWAINFTHFISDVCGFLVLLARVFWGTNMFQLSLQLALFSVFKINFRSISLTV